MAEQNPTTEQPNGAQQSDIDAFLEPQVPEAPPELVGGQPVSPVPSDGPVGRPSAPPAQDDERLSKALQTIESLQRDLADIKGRQSPQVVYTGPQAQRDSMPEMVEIMPGRYIPKDPSQRAIKLRPEDLVRMGWNDDPAAALNALANAFFHHIAEVVPQMTMSQLQEQGRAYNAGQTRKEAFFGDFPDLKEFGDLADVVERQAMQELPIQNMTQGDWNREVGNRVRSRIAAMRGISMEQYTASLGSRPGGAPRPRAVTAPPSGSGRRSPATGDQQREMDDLLEGRL